MPSSSSAASDGMTLLQWQEIIVHGFGYHDAMLFNDENDENDENDYDGYDVWAGVTHEYVG